MKLTSTYFCFFFFLMESSKKLSQIIGTEGKSMLLILLIISTPAFWETPCLPFSGGGCYAAAQVFCLQISCVDLQGGSGDTTTPLTNYKEQHTFFLPTAFKATFVGHPQRRHTQKDQSTLSWWWSLWDKKHAQPEKQAMGVIDQNHSYPSDKAGVKREMT